MALLLAAIAVLLALVYASLAAAQARPAVRAGTILLAALLLVVAPTAAFMGMGAATERPYGQDGGVVQLPLAIDKILAGESPYGADYSGTVLARQARVSTFWDELGGNPILRHHAYLPGTHLVMLPFHLLSRAALGGFDPRSVTLLFYALVVLLAARLPASAEARLAAAGVAALNPLVYWHQIFGANDLVFVAMVLGAVLLARGERRVAAAALLGLACATKQLAWPFAPFLLVALSGARTFAGLLGSWRRLLRPLVVLVAVFLAVVLPVAALDFRAFWGDIVVYNVGLPGGDNYPLGGTPGVGFANYIVCFGRLASLRDYFPFSVFYVLLVPLGLLLVRAQLRDGRPEWALATGTTALLASLYFSRVVHPNYLVPAAVLLPLAVLALRRGADVALAPLLLLALAVEAAENQVFRNAWEQATAAGLPARVQGLAAALVPKAGPHLTKDPLGLLFGATAAGLGVLYLALAVGGAPRRSRTVVTVLGAVLLVGLPAALLAGLSDRTGVVRAQDPAVVQAQADAGRLIEGRSPYTTPPETSPRGREAFSRSFRLDPPAEIRPSSPLLPPGPVRRRGCRPAPGGSRPAPAGRRGARPAGRAARRRDRGTKPSSGARRRAVGGPDRPRDRARGARRPPAHGARGRLDCRPPRERPRRRPARGGRRRLRPSGGPRGAVPAVRRPAAGGRGGRAGPLPVGRALVGALAAYALLVGPVALLDPASFAARVASSVAPGAGLGVVNVLAYRGAEASPAAFALAAIAPLLAAGFVLWLLGRPWPPLAQGAIASLGWLVLAPAASPEAVAVPLVLLGLAALGPAGEPTLDGQASAP